jgi:iron uptake system component EfeO
MKNTCLAAAFALVALGACGSDDEPKTDAEFQAKVLTDVRNYLLGWSEKWLAAAKTLQAAAPVTTGRGWDATQDAAAITAMKAAWMNARDAYEHTEGVLAPLFPDQDVATDARYDDFLDELKPLGDANPFDAEGVTGMHGIERILYAPAIPVEVVTFEQALPGYVPAAFPANELQSTEFKTKLSAKLVTDVQTLNATLANLRFDLPAAFNGVIDLVQEQVEKVDKAATGEEESRYAQSTMRDLRSNAKGCKEFYRLFSPWLKSKGAAGTAATVAAGAAFARLDSAYAAVPTEAIPLPPADWSSISPSPSALATPFGILWSAVHAEADASKPGTLAHAMEASLTTLGWQRAQ